MAGDLDDLEFEAATERLLRDARRKEAGDKFKREHRVWWGIICAATLVVLAFAALTASVVAIKLAVELTRLIW